jgi:hypothetical protein
VPPVTATAADSGSVESVPERSFGMLPETTRESFFSSTLTSGLFFRSFIQWVILFFSLDTLNFKKGGDVLRRPGNERD